MKTVENMQLTLNEEEILRLLSSTKGSRRKKRKASEEILQNIHDEMVSSMVLIKPKGVYKIVDSSSLEPSFLFKKSEKTIIAVCTIGKELEQKGTQLIQKGELAQGVIIDAIASHAAEMTAEYLNMLILEDIKDVFKDKKFTSRFSPGYCQWELGAGQETIFNLLNTEKIGVALSETMMMDPIKSVSFAINIGDEIDEELGKRGCETCDMINCPYRRVKQY